MVEYVKRDRVGYWSFAAWDVEQRWGPRVSQRAFELLCRWWGL